MMPVKTFSLLACFELHLIQMFIIMEIIYFSIDSMSKIMLIFKFNQTLHSKKVDLLLHYTSNQYRIV